MSKDVTQRAIRKVWENHDDEEYRRDQSHWRGHGRWADDKLWQSIGRKSISRFNAILNYLRKGPQTWTSPKSFLEWGPGGGANLFALSRLASRYYGIDISNKNLAECQRIADGRNFTGFSPILLAGSPATVIDAIDRPVNAFLSTAVFQHFPSKSYGEEALRTIAKASRSGAIGFIQIRFDNGNEKYRGIRDISEYEEKHIRANSYAIDEFWGLCSKCEFEVLYVSDVSSVANYATFNLMRK
ncbi:MAG: class I SAM-dependent methyltransferase [Parasphingopyxis sp.]|uniref:class I SAM-dependent methyltransferase n=1 Tax=Parasphingopyxis sp. TaxID=1920299 RepID=UPI003FA07A66